MEFRGTVGRFDEYPVDVPSGDAGEFSKLPRERPFDVDQLPKILGTRARGLKRPRVVSTLPTLAKV